MDQADLVVDTLVVIPVVLKLAVAQKPVVETLVEVLKLAVQLAALKLVPRMLSKRGGIVRRLSAREVAALLRRYRAPLRELA